MILFGVEQGVICHALPIFQTRIVMPRCPEVVSNILLFLAEAITVPSRWFCLTADNREQGSAIIAHALTAPATVGSERHPDTTGLRAGKEVGVSSCESGDLPSNSDHPSICRAVGAEQEPQHAYRTRRRRRRQDLP